MGPQARGGISSHLLSTKKAVQRWLNQENGTTAVKDDLLARSLSFAHQSEEQPQALTWARRIKRFGALFWEGGLANQPYIFMLEVNTALDCEQEAEDTRLFNLQQRLKHGK